MVRCNYVSRVKSQLWFLHRFFFFSQKFPLRWTAARTISAIWFQWQFCSIYAGYGLRCVPRPQSAFLYGKISRWSNDMNSSFITCLLKFSCDFSQCHSMTCMVPHKLLQGTEASQFVRGKIHDNCFLVIGWLGLTCIFLQSLFDDFTEVFSNRYC